MDSWRGVLLGAVGECLQRILKVNGFATDAGASYTPEPGQVDASASAVLAALILKQERATQAGLVRTHRLTTVGVLIKLPALPQEEQAILEAAISDAERALDGQQARFAAGIEYPQYISMEPVKPDPGAGWVGALLTYQSHIPK
ncbi:hypothetical protein NG829_08480 [Xanthomonas sacchari]|uniref:hypothetical protein n=1 Tax=Xanthomonas sacchari TaxID=56458 RepID=UPI00225E4A87|nr:hypothetical protein [Xanthomonas sacchari]UYK82312.1 hypothetical protein NG829_08480 [Xanthomonas sacchari]